MERPRKTDPHGAAFIAAVGPSDFLDCQPWDDFSPEQNLYWLPIFARIAYKIHGPGRD
jgi:hypothetical protein